MRTSFSLKNFTPSTRTTISLHTWEVEEHS